MRIRPGLLALAFALAGGSLPTSATAQESDLAAAMEEAYRLGLEAWANADIDLIASGQGSAVGFGFRTLAPRGVDDATAGYPRPLLEAFFASMDYYNLRLDEIHTSVHGNVGVAWGFHTEEFRHRGRESEAYRVRFSFTVIRGEDGALTQLISHRDIQPFGDDGRYIPRYQPNGDDAGPPPDGKLPRSP